MPHIIIEYPADRIGETQLPPLLDAVHTAVAASGLFETANIKTRAIALHHYRLADGDGAFLHVQCRIHRGRSEVQRQGLGEAVLAALWGQGRLAVEVMTVEVVEMERAGYAKYAP
jgi:5-carboxymethyl-2-hydroxymuconate isomerase